MTDVTQALRDTENALRDFIAATLEPSLGSAWLDQCGVTPARLETWKARKAEERRRQGTGLLDERLLYYADFYDLKTILKAHWQRHFSGPLGEWKRFAVFFDELEDFRNPDAHRRPLLPHQESLAEGIAGDIRSRLIRWRSSRETADDCFPRIEAAHDSLGNLWVPSNGSSVVHTATILRPGDRIDFVITARDPEDLLLEYRLKTEMLPVRFPEPSWQASNQFSVDITEAHIGETLLIDLEIRSPRSYHRRTVNDDVVVFRYTVLPRPAR